MAMFIDRHSALSVPSAVKRRVFREGLQHYVDTRGVQVVGHWLEDGSIYCVIEAPDSEAACQHHAERGLSCSELHHIAGLRGGQPTPAEDTAMVRAAISTFWHTRTK
jgi:Protein of unknown function (DUF4242)